MYKNIHNSNIHNSPKLETAQRSIDRKMAKEIVEPSYDKILHSNENKLLIIEMNLKNALLSERNQT